MSMAFNINETGSARVCVDALAGKGLIFLEGEIVGRGFLGEYFDLLVAQGAIELCDPELHTSPALLIDLA